jgi:hypothetical protein
MEQVGKGVGGDIDYTRGRLNECTRLRNTMHEYTTHSFLWPLELGGGRIDGVRVWVSVWVWVWDLCKSGA